MMKRDMDLVRQILLAIEDHEHGIAPQPFQVPGDYTKEVVGYHVFQMGEAGLLEVAKTTHLSSPSPSAIPIRLTWAGHEFLDNARNQNVWTKVKRVVADKGGSVSFEVLKFLVVQTAKDYFLPGDAPPVPPAP